MWLKRIKNWSIYILIRVIISIAKNIPRGWAFGFLKAVGWLVYVSIPRFRNKTIENLRIAFGGEKEDAEIKRMARRVFLNLGRNAADAIRLQKFTPHNIDRYVKAIGLENMDRALKKGKGVLAITGHIGNWELLGAYLALKGYPLNVVGAKLYDHRLNKIIVENREKAGLRNITRGSGTREILRALKRGEVVGILIDQDTRVEGTFVDFFGRKAFTPIGPVLLAMKTGAPLIPLAIHIKEDNTHLITVEEELSLEFTGDPESDLIVNTQRCTHEIEKFIRRDPTQWVWMHDRWKTREEDISKKRNNQKLREG